MLNSGWKDREIKGIIRKQDPYPSVGGLTRPAAESLQGALRPDWKEGLLREALSKESHQE